MVYVYPEHKQFQIKNSTIMVVKSNIFPILVGNYGVCFFLILVIFGMSATGSCLHGQESLMHLLFFSVFTQAIWQPLKCQA